MFACSNVPDLRHKARFSYRKRCQTSGLLCQIRFSTLFIFTEGDLCTIHPYLHTGVEELFLKRSLVSATSLPYTYITGETSVTKDKLLGIKGQFDQVAGETQLTRSREAP